MAEGGVFRSGPQTAPRGGHQNDASGRGECADRLQHQALGVVGFFEGMNQQDAVERAGGEGQAAILDKDRPVLADGGPQLDTLPARHGRDDAAGADEGVQPWRCIAQPQNIAVRRLTPGVFQSAGQHPTRERTGRLAVENPQVFDTAPHGATIDPPVRRCQNDRMTLEVRLFPCLNDNYGFLIRDGATGQVATVDTPDADAVLADLERSGWGRLDLILNTHWHPDHTQGNAAIKAATGCEIVGPEEVRRAAPLDRVVRHGETVKLGDTVLEVTEAPGHTLGHIVYRSVEDAQAFVGDVMFVMGCGRLFEGSPHQMWTSLQTLAAWPDDTIIWCAHEYTASNARFALSVDDREETAARAAEIFAMRERGEPTVPTTIRSEKTFNPFVRAVDAEQFAILRAAKDGFTG